MNKQTIFLIKLTNLFLLCLLIISCGEPNQKQINHSAIGFENSDECHVCGMVIQKFSGPKGQAFDKRSNRIEKFCSTAELIFWYLQPENTNNVAEIYVHDMTKTSWDKPDNSQLILARDAFYVINSSKQGSMGKTLASFLSSNDAAKFANQYGGQVITFNALTLDSISL